MSGALRELRRAQPWLGTLVSIRVAARSDVPLPHLNSQLEQAFAAIARVHCRLSYHETDSALSRINRDAQAHAVHLDADCRTVVRAALDLAAASEGAFDPTVAGTLENWGYLPRRGAALAPGASWRDIELDALGQLRFHRPLRLDLGGIAKGYAVDLASESLTAAGIEDHVVNAGGDLRVGDGRAHIATLRDPRNPGSVARSILLRRRALATSGSYFQRRVLGDREVSHLVDAHRDAPFLRHDASASVLAAQCIVADALTKVVLFAERELAERVLRTYDAEAIVLQPSEAAA